MAGRQPRHDGAAKAHQCQTVATALRRFRSAGKCEPEQPLSLPEDRAMHPLSPGHPDDGASPRPATVFYPSPSRAELNVIVSVGPDVIPLAAMDIATLILSCDCFECYGKAFVACVFPMSRTPCNVLDHGDDGIRQQTSWTQIADTH